VKVANKEQNGLS